MNRNYSAHAATGPVSTVSETMSGKSGSRDGIEWKPCVFIPVPDAIEGNSDAAWRAWDQAQDEARARVKAINKPTLGNLVDRLGNWPVPEVSGDVKKKEQT